MCKLTELTKIILWFLIAGFSATLSAEIYKWVDEDGQVHYSETPPRNTDVKKIKIDKSSTDPAKALEKLKEKSTAFSERRDQRQQTSEEQKAAADEAKTNQENCAKLRKNLEVLTTHNQVRMTQQDGSQVMLGDQQRLDKIDAIKKQISEQC